MADTKVSALTELTATPAASDEIYINDGGTSKKIQYSALMGWARTADEITGSVTPSDYSYPPGNVLRYGAVGDGTTDDSGAFQDAHDGLHATRGGVITVPRPAATYRLTSSVAISKQSVTIQGTQSIGQVEGSAFTSTMWGCGISCDTSSVAMFEYDAGGGSIVHSGPVFKDLMFFGPGLAWDGSTTPLESHDADSTNIIAIRLDNINNWVIDHCLFRGLDIGIQMDFPSGGDNAWGLVDNCSFQKNIRAIDVEASHGFEVRGGKFNQNRDYAIYFNYLASSARIIGTMFDGCGAGTSSDSSAVRRALDQYRGTGVYSEGAGIQIEACKFERQYPAIEIAHNASLAQSGSGHVIAGHTCQNLGGDDDVIFGSGTFSNVIVHPHFSWSGTPVNDSGSNNVFVPIPGLAEESATGTFTFSGSGYAKVDSSGGAVTGTLGSGTHPGAEKVIVMTDASNSSTVSVTNHETSDPEVFTFAQVDDTLILRWTGTEWITAVNSGVGT